MFPMFNFSLETLFSISFGFIVALLFLLTCVKRKKNVPPGPIGLPFVGYLPFLTENPHLKLWDLSLKYGNIFSFKLGSKLTVVLNDGQIVREAFSKTESLGRPLMPAMVLNKVDTPFMMDEKFIWRDHRRFILKSLRDLGLGKTKMHSHVQEEIKCLIKRIRQQNGKPLHIKLLLTPSMSNNICSLIFGKRYEHDDPERIFMDEAIEETSMKMGQTANWIYYPWIMPAAMKIQKYFEPSFSKIGKMQLLVRQKIKEHFESIDDNDMRDLIDMYLIEMKNKKNNNQVLTFSDLKLAGAAQTLFAAGSETVRTSVEWCLSVMAVYPDVQKKVQEEIAESIGDQRMPCFADYKNTPYTQSMLQEILRWKTIAPINILRKALDDMEISGYSIPKGTFIMANLWAVMHNPKDWKNPEQFIPDRFLSSDSKTLLKDENFMPFSYGKRACPGEGLAMLEFYLYVTSILQKFNITVPNGGQLNLNGKLGVTYQLQPQELIFISRI